MASRKKKNAGQAGFDLSLPPSETQHLPSVPATSAVDLDRGVIEAELAAFDDYAEPEESIDPASVARVVVESVGADCFEVAKFGWRGMAVARVVWTRDELRELIGRAQAALEVQR